MKDHSSATTGRGALASSKDQLERLPKTASHPFTHGDCQSVRCLQDYSISLSLEPWPAYINVFNTHATST